MSTEYKWDLGVKLANRIEAGDADAVSELLDDVFSNILESGTGTLDEIKLRVARTLAIAMRAAYAAGANPRELLAAKNRNLEDIIKAGSKQNLKDLLFDRCVHAARLVEAERLVIDAKLPQAVEYIREHATDGISRSDIADLLGCSRDHVSRLFSRVLGKHFKDFVLECRIEKAKQLLLDKDDKIIDIAFYAGFSDPNYFGTCFKRLTGVTPSQYRRMSAQKNA